MNTQLLKEYTSKKGGNNVSKGQRNSKRMNSPIMNSTGTRDSFYSTNQSMKNPLDESIRSCRYKLNQYYLNKFNEEKPKMERTISPNRLNQFAKSSFLMEKMRSPIKIPSGIEDNKQSYDFKQNLFDDTYQARLESFNERRQKSPSNRDQTNLSQSRLNNSNADYSYSTNQSYMTNQCHKLYAPSSDCYNRSSNLSTAVPPRRNQRTNEDLPNYSMNCHHHLSYY